MNTIITTNGYQNCQLLFIFNLIIDYNGNLDAMVVFSDMLYLSMWPILRPPGISDLEILTTSGCFVVMKKNTVKQIYI